jgi:aminoglycoside phosphotransferase (APT) family kinase protein
VLRLAADPSAYTVFPEYDMPRQYRTMRLVAEHTDVPVPQVLWLEEDPGPLGAPFFVMERVEGRVPPDVMPYTYAGNWLHAASDAERARLEAATVGLLARLHDQVPPKEAEFLALPGEGDALRRHVAAQRGYYAWVVDGLPRSPLIEAAFDRLAELWPRDPGPPVLTWGDARIGNIVYDGFEPAAVLDWEMAALAPREVDLGWTVYLHRFFQDLTRASGQPGLPDLLRLLHAVRRAAARDRDAAGRPPPGALRGGGRARGPGHADPAPRQPAGHGAGRLLGPSAVSAAQAACRRISGTRIGREPGPPTCEKGCIRQSSP